MRKQPYEDNTCVCALETLFICMRAPACDINAKAVFA